MAAAAAAALLDELMGRNRNAAPNEKAQELNWEDSEYCKYYMVQFCPHDLFVNTRADLGACTKIHDDEVKRLYQDSTSHKKVQYIDEFVRFCSSILNEVTRKIEKGKQRLMLMANAENVSLTPAQTQRNTEQIALLSDKINKLVEEAEAVGIQGNVEQAQGLMKLCDQLKEERNTLRKQVENSHWTQTATLAAEQEKQMEVCEVCGAFLIVGDAQQRIDDHLMGKQHVGYARLKTAVDEMSKERDKWRESREKKRDAERRERQGSTPARRDRERERDGRREERDRSDRDRERDRRDDRGKEKEKDKERHRRGDDDRRERDRDRDRDRDRRRDRSRDSKNRRGREDDRHDSRRRSRDGLDRDRDRDLDGKRARRDRSSDPVNNAPSAPIATPDE